MLWLKRVIYPTDFFKCDATGKILMYGDFYYEDDETGKRIDAQYYHNQKMQMRKENWPYNEKKEFYTSDKEYRKEMERAEQEALAAEILNKPIGGHAASNRSKELGTYQGGF